MAAITTPFALFEHLRVPFGLRNAAQTSQRFIDNTVRGFPFAYAYLDYLEVKAVRMNHLMASSNTK